MQLNLAPPCICIMTESLVTCLSSNFMTGTLVAEWLLEKEWKKFLSAGPLLCWLQQGRYRKYGRGHQEGEQHSSSSHVGSSNCLQPICSWVDVILLCIFISTHLKLLLELGDILAQILKLECISLV